MVENEKSSRIKTQFLNELYDLILSESITEEERRVLTKAKNLVEKGEYIPNVIRRMQTNFTLDAINSNLSPSVSEFYSTLPKTLAEILPAFPGTGSSLGIPL
ncbi:bacteriocin immunity protein [Lactococcus lactis]|uniref:bacteriocin immunity protein n=1 Tax=Lactococcus lactis TaxID=1358 RepID=UPI0026E36289|nr:bacteriocin immunity protein [Lactococcus lactis]MCG6977209.1 bacteriocin immunity protein [Lactococcus lactis]MDO6179045.1 bacteriocin immunity protein [Lactococcus lactis]